MEREHIFVGLLLISFFLLLPSVPAPSTVPIDSFCEDSSSCANMCTSSTTYIEYVCSSGFCQSTHSEQACPSGTSCQNGACVSSSSGGSSPQYCTMNEVLCGSASFELNYCEGFTYMSCSGVRSAAQSQGHSMQGSTVLLPPGWIAKTPGFTASSTSSSCVVHPNYQYTLQGCQDQGYIRCEDGSTPRTEPRTATDDGSGHLTYTPHYLTISCEPATPTNDPSPPAPNPPACGAAAGSYSVSATSYRSGWCEEGTPSNTPSAFLGVGGTTTWYCSNSHESVTCSASRDRCSDNRYWDGSSCVSGPEVSINVQVDGLPRNNVYVDQNPNSILEGASYDQDLRGTTGDIEGGYLRTRASNEDVVNAHLRVPSVSGASFVGWNTVANNGWGCNYLTGSGNCGISVLGTGAKTIVASFTTNSQPPPTTPPPVPPVCGTYNSPCDVGIVSHYSPGLACGTTSWQCNNDGIVKHCSGSAGTCSGGTNCYNNACYPPPSITQFSATPATHQAPFQATFTIQTSGGAPPLSYTINTDAGMISQGNLPPGFSHSPQATFYYPASYSPLLTVRDATGTQATRTTSVTATNYVPQILEFSVSPDDAPAPFTATYTARIRDASPRITYEIGLSDGSTVTGQSVNPTYNQDYEHVITHEYEIPVHDLNACDPNAVIHEATLQVNDYFSEQASSSTSLTAHPIVNHQVPASCAAQCDSSITVFSEHEGFGACYHFGFVSVELMLRELNGNAYPLGATVRLLNQDFSSLDLVTSFSSSPTVFSPVIVGDYRVQATHLDAYENTSDVFTVESQETSSVFLNFFEGIYSSSCTNEFGLCDRAAIGHNGCLDNPSDPLYEQQRRVLELCHPEGRSRGFAEGTHVVYERNDTHTTYASCCLDVLEPVETPKVELETNATALIRTQQRVLYKGRTVHLVITTFS